MKNININMRIGIHSGMVLSGIIGVHKWQFDIWSQDSILASSMEHDGVPGYVHVTRETLDLVHEIALQKYIIEGRNRRCSSTTFLHFHTVVHTQREMSTNASAISSHERRRALQWSSWSGRTPLPLTIAYRRND